MFGTTGKGIPMGKLLKLKEITREEDLPQIKGGSLSILLGANLRSTSPATSKTQSKVKHSDDDDTIVLSPDDPAKGNLE